MVCIERRIAKGSYEIGLSMFTSFPTTESDSSGAPSTVLFTIEWSTHLVVLSNSEQWSNKVGPIYRADWDPIWFEIGYN
jgi:hypothetical protein